VAFTVGFRSAAAALAQAGPRRRPRGPGRRRTAPATTPTPAATRAGRGHHAATNQKEHTPMSNPVTHLEVVGRDAQALQRFYSEAFGWQMKPAGPGYAMALPAADRGINGGVGSAPDGRGPRVTFYIEVTDLEGTLADVERLGATRVIDPI